jgi:hypothetical protein
MITGDILTADAIYENVIDTYQLPMVDQQEKVITVR